MHAGVYSSRVPELCAVLTQTVMTARGGGRERERRGRWEGDYREKERADMREKESENDKLFQKNRHEPSDST